MAIESFVRLIENLGVDAVGSELAEVLWFARLIDPSPATTASTRAPRGPAPDRVRQGTPAARPTDTAGVDARVEQVDAYVETVGEAASIPIWSSPVRVREAPMLRSPREIERALLPLKRKVPSERRWELDEDATAQRIAEDGIWSPLMRPALERWLELALVVDSTESMRVWRGLVGEVRSALENLGAFRDVRAWYLRSSDERDSPLGVAAAGTDVGRSADVQTVRPIAELIDTSGRRVFMIISDCVGGIWRDGRAGATISCWAHTGPVVVVQPLPERLWHRTGLPPRNARAYSPAPAAAGGELSFQAYGPRNHRAAASASPQGMAVCVPVVGVSPHSLAAWARLVAAASQDGVDIAVATLETIREDAARYEDSMTVGSDPHRDVQRFRATASPEAFQLAKYFASAPLSLPVMRLVQAALLPLSNTTHLAEVLLSGLLLRTSVGNHGSDEEIQFDFTEGSREILLGGLRREEMLRVLHATSDYIERHGTPVGPDFRAAVPDGSTRDSLVQQQPFARIIRSTLERMGVRVEHLAMQATSVEMPTRVRRTVVRRSRRRTTAVSWTQVAGRPVTVTGGNDGYVRVWDLPSGRQRAALQGPPGTLWSIACTTVEGHSVAMSGGNDGTLRMWDLAEGREVGGAETASEVNSLAVGVINGGPTAITGGSDGSLTLWELSYGGFTGRLIQRSGPIRSLAFVDDEGTPLAVSAGSERSVRVWDLQSGAQAAELSGHTDWVWAVDCLATGGRTIAVSGSSDRTIRVWDLRTGTALATHTSGPDWVRALKCTEVAGRPLIIMGGDSGALVALDLHSGETVAHSSAYSSTIRSLTVVDVDGQPLVIFGDEGPGIEVWALPDVV